MTVGHEHPHRTSSLAGAVASSVLEDRFELIKEIGDGSFGSVSLARVRGAGAQIARRGTMVAIKTMKKTFDSFQPCLELREVIFLRTLPVHPHLVPALDIFLDPLTKRLHICMEYMDGNLYQLLKDRDHRCLDGASVKSILFQILAGLDHVHAHDFFHRDIKPENILISASGPPDATPTFRRYSAMATPPATPPAYTVKIADFGLARETRSKLPYTTYVSTRWYRAPEVLLRAGEYSAPVDLWAVGAMAVEVATLKPLFPGGNEVDQVWRVCGIMGSPGNWHNKHGAKVGGGEWREGARLAEKLGFTFPKMAPHAMDAILSRPQWPASLAHLVTWCLMWDPKNRPTSVQAMNHEYFTDAVDPLRPRSSASRLLGRKQSHHEQKAPKESVESSPASTRSSWFRKSLIGRDSAPVVPQHAGNAQLASPRPSPVHSTAVPPVDVSPHHRPNVGKRATWTNGTAPPGGAPMPILPSIRPISPLSNSVTAQASKAKEDGAKTPKKIGRQLSVASHGNHYGQDGDRTLTGNGGLASPTSGQKESFFSHLRKRARRLSGRSQLPHSPKYDDIEANAGAFASNRSSMALDSHSPAANPAKNEFAELDKALRSVRYSLDASQHGPNQAPTQSPAAAAAALKRHHSFQQVNGPRPLDEHPLSTGPGPISSRTRRALQYSTHPSHRYETPDEEEELLDEALHGVHRAVRGIDRPRAVDGEANRNVLASKDANRLPPLNHSVSAGLLTNPYPTPSPSAKRNGVLFTSSLMDQPATPLSMTRSRSRLDVATWSTPPEENDWVASATQSIFAGSSFYR